MSLITKAEFFLFFIIILGFFCFVPNTAQAASSSIRYTTVYGKKYTYLRDVARFYGMTCTYSGDKAILSSKYSRLVFTMNKKYCHINKTKVNLITPAVKYKYFRCISVDDFFKTIDPIMRHWALNKKPVKIIMIDPGHGGTDNGGSGKRINERMVTLPIAKKVAFILQKSGYKVYLTRNRDKSLSLEQRPALAKQIKADIFVSIHANKATSPNASGIETFCVTPVGAASTHSRKPSYTKHPNNKHNANNVSLAYHIQNALIKKTKAVDRGMKHARFMVIKQAECPAALVEVGFLSNIKEENRIATDWYQWVLARGIAEGIKKYHYQVKRRK